MTAIRLECETCHARLRVRDEGFIGQVHACPRCGSMVQIMATLPADASAAGSCEVAPSDPEQATPLTLGLSETLTAEFDPDAAAGDSAGSEDAVVVAEESAASLAASAPLAVTAMALVATGVLIVSWAVRGPASDEVATGPAIEIGKTSPPATIGALVVDSPDTEPESLAEVVATTPTTASPPALPLQEPAPEAQASDPEPPPNAEPTTTAVAQQPDDQPEPVEEETGPIDPLGFDPDALELVLVKSAGAATARETDPSAEPSATTPSPAAPPSEQRSLDARLTEAARRGAVWARPEPSEQAPLSLDPAAPRLAMTLPSIALSRAPLDEAVTLLGELAGTPITLTPRALLRAGMRANRPIDVRGDGRSLATLLDDGLESARLGFEVDGPHTRVVRRGASVRRIVPHRLSDLVGDTPDVLTSLLSSLGFALPSDAEISAPKTPLDLTMGEHCDLLIVCETLRVARSLPTASKYPTEALPIRSAWLAMGERLQRRTTFSFVRPTELRDVVAHWRRTLEAPVLIDWPSLADAELGPASTIACAATNQPWSAALDGVLEPLGLGWAPVHGGAVWIATPERLAAAESIALYSPREADTAGRVTAPRAPPRVASDPESGAAIVSAPPTVHRRIAAALDAG